MANLKQKTIRGLGWSGLAQVGRQGISLITTAILARLLSPNDFGLVAMVSVFMNFALIFTEMSISSALIQKQDTHERHYYSAFWFNIFVGICLTIFFIVLSPQIARFYKKPELVPILAVISLNLFFSSFVIIQQMILTKVMDFKSLAIRDIVAVVLSGILGIYLAYHGFGVWSLVYQSIAFTLFNAVLLWVLSSWRPKFEFSIADIKDIFSFSANLVGFNIINYFARNIDQLLIGKFLGVQALGFYSLAYKLMLYPLQNITGVIGRVMFPAFAKIQDNLEKVCSAYFKTVKAIALIAFPIMLGLFAITPVFISVVFGPQWMPASMTIRILCICGLFQSIGTTVGMIYLSMGRADLQFRLQLLGTGIVFISVLGGLRWGINGVALFYTIQSILWTNINVYIISRLTGFSFKSFYSNLVSSFVIATGAIVPGVLIQRVISVPLFFHFGLFVACWVLLYVVLLFATKEIVFRNKVLTLAILN